MHACTPEQEQGHWGHQPAMRLLQLVVLVAQLSLQVRLGGRQPQERLLQRRGFFSLLKGAIHQHNTKGFSTNTAQQDSSAAQHLTQQLAERLEKCGPMCSLSGPLIVEQPKGVLSFCCEVG
jgi:hypothetical protein